MVIASQDAAIRKLCEELNEIEVVVPGTEIRLVYEAIVVANQTQNS